MNTTETSKPTAQQGNPGRGPSQPPTSPPPAANTGQAKMPASHDASVEFARQQDRAISQVQTLRETITQLRRESTELDAITHTGVGRVIDQTHLDAIRKVKELVLAVEAHARNLQPLIPPAHS